MKEFTFEIRDKDGLHARPAGILVKCAKKYESSVTIRKEGKSCDMKALIKLMGMGIKQGDVVTVAVEGNDEETCMDALLKEFSDNL